MKGVATLEAVHVEATPAAGAEEAPAASLQLLDGDEIVQLSIKPSLWYIPLASLRFVLVVGLLAAAAAIAAGGAASQWPWLALQALIVIAIVRVAVAALQWASRLYVLTNRRAMRFRGVFSVDVSECPLAKISAADLMIAGYQRGLRLGTIRMKPAVEDLTGVVWEQVAKPAEVHETLLRAIRRAQSGE